MFICYFIATVSFWTNFFIRQLLIRQISEMVLNILFYLDNGSFSSIIFFLNRSMFFEIDLDPKILSHLTLVHDILMIMILKDRDIFNMMMKMSNVCMYIFL